MDNLKALQQAKDALAKAIEEKKLAQELLKNLGPAVIKTIQPILEQLVSNSKITKDELLAALSTVTFNVPQIEIPHSSIDVTLPKIPEPIINVNVPEVKVPEIIIPPIIVPKPEVTVNIPDFPKFPDIPPMKWPEGEMNINGWVSLMGYDKGLLSNPLPVQLRDAKGNPIHLGGSVVSGGGGGGAGVGSLSQVNGRLQVDVINGAGSALQVSGAADSVNVIGPIAQGDSATAVRVVVAGNSDVSTKIISPIAQGDSATAVRVVIAGNSDASVFVNGGNLNGIGTISTITNPVDVTGSVVSITGGVSVGISSPIGAGSKSTGVLVHIADDENTLVIRQVSGAADSVNVVGPIDQGDAATALRVVVAGNSDMSVVAQYPDGQGDSATALRTIQAGDSVSSVYVNNPVGQGDSATALRVIQAGDAVSSVYVNNPVAQGDAATALRVVVAGNSDMSVKVISPVDNGDQATALRTVQAGNSLSSVEAHFITIVNSFASPGTNGGSVQGSADSLGRTLVRPITVRQLIATAYTTLANGTRTQIGTAIAGPSNSYFDLIWMMATNNSDKAVQVDIYDHITTGGIVMTLQLPANFSQPYSFSPPFPQSDVGQGWSADLQDVTGTTVNISAMFENTQN